MPRTKSPQAFKRVTVDYSIANTARIEWHMRDDFNDPLPWTFQLEVSRDAGHADSWEDVGAAVTDFYYALDDTQRLYGKHNTVLYRVRLNTPRNEYYSENAQPLGNLTKRQWLLARAMIRRILLIPNNITRFAGYLLKRRTYGTVCPDCVDTLTGAITNADCTTCLGTGKTSGYWRAAQHDMFNRTPMGIFLHQDPGGTRATINDDTIGGMFIGIPQMVSKDVWIDATSDRRFYVERAEVRADYDGVPLVTAATLRLAAFTDIVYKINSETGALY